MYKLQYFIKFLISLSKFNLPLIDTFTWPMPPGPYRATTCRGRELNYGSHDILFWPHKDMEGLPGWVISSMPGPPPRQHKHERQYKPSTHSVKPTRRIWNDDYDGRMIFGDLGGLKFPDICLTGEGKPRKNPYPGNLSRPGIEPGPAAWEARMLPLPPQRWTTIIVTSINVLFLANSGKLDSRDLSRLPWDLAFHSQVWRTIFIHYPRKTVHGAP